MKKHVSSLDFTATIIVFFITFSALNASFDLIRLYPIILSKYLLGSACVLARNRTKKETSGTMPPVPGNRSVRDRGDQCPPTFRRPLAARDRTSTSAIAMTT
jgi:hypothetical protein